MIAKKGGRVNEIIFEVCALIRTSTGEGMEFETLIKVGAHYGSAAAFGLPVR